MGCGRRVAKSGNELQECEANAGDGEFETGLNDKKDGKGEKNEENEKNEKHKDKSQRKKKKKMRSSQGTVCGKSKYGATFLYLHTLG